MPELIAPNALKELVDAQAVHGASVLGDEGGYVVMVKYGQVERAVAARSSSGQLSVRKFASLDSVNSFLRTRIHLAQYDVDSRSYQAPTRTARDESSAARLKRMHEAAAYDAWFRAQVDEAVKEADDPSTLWISNKDAKAGWAKKRAALAKRPARGGV